MAPVLIPPTHLETDLLVGPHRQVPDALHLLPGPEAGGPEHGEGEGPRLSGLQLPGAAHGGVEEPAHEWSVVIVKTSPLIGQWS